MCGGNGFRGTSSSANTSVQKKSEILKKDSMETPTEGVLISLVRLLNIVCCKEIFVVDKYEVARIKKCSCTVNRRK